MSSGVFCFLYLVVMFFTYIWRYLIIGMPVGMEDAGVSPEEAINTTVSFIYWALIINYLLLIWISYSRGKKNNRKYIATFPLIGGFFDIVLAFIPLVPTIMNIVTLIMGVSDNKKIIVYVNEKGSEEGNSDTMR